MIFAAGVTPLQGAAWRATGAFAIVLLYCLLTNQRALRVARRDLALFALYGAISVAVYMVVYLIAIERTTVATAAVLLYTAPVWVVILARVLFAEPMTRMKIVALLLTFAGTMLVIGGAGASGLRVDLYGIFAGLAAGLTYGLYSIFGKLTLRRYSPLTTVVYSLGFGALLLLVASRGLRPVPAEGRLALAYLIAVPTVAAYVLYAAGLRRVEAGRASIVATLEPVVAAAAGALILREPFGAGQWLGAVLVLVGVALVQRDRQERTPEQPQIH